MRADTESKQRMASKPGLHVVMFPFFAFGHISPFVQLSNKLSSHGVRVSFFSAAGNVDRILSMLDATNLTTQIVPLSIPAVDGLPQGLESTADMPQSTSALLLVALDLMKPQIDTLLLELNPDFVFFDFAQQWLPAMAAEQGIKTIFYSVFTAISTAFLTVPSRVVDWKKGVTVEELKAPPSGFPKTAITGVRTFEAQDFMFLFNNFHTGTTGFHRVIRALQSCTAILVKACTEMEAPYIDYVKSQFDKPILLAGPVVPEPRPGELEERWAKWLDQFPSRSVIYCSFGSETFLTDDQIKELTLGLELTGLPFFLVLNFPADSSKALKMALPEGFLERVNGKGIAHTGWVQQQQILAHSSVGCYLCHAGFSSVIEALVNDCQLVMLPQKGDQYMNSKLVSLDLKAGVEINRRDEDGHFGRHDVYKAVQSVMVDVDSEPGKLMTANQKKWKEFLLNNNIQNQFTADLVREMKAMASENI
ncbi:hypothetical protein RJ639_039754 [Escallonia herrerae]|uniref:Glycosyltransferase n=1 Tax=Escallonia herrerae TaxID=1293975 RepID=A0AA88WPE1_9ASTE|nr:hypothetical protein RJ639_039754 [Escallonia herrerae]